MRWIEDRRIRAIRCVRKRIRDGANKRTIPFGLSERQVEFLINQPCVYADGNCSRSMFDPSESRNRIRFGKNSQEIFFWMGIDRIDSALGYEWKNCIPCCWYHNSIKCKVTLKMATTILALNEVKNPYPDPEKVSQSENERVY